MPICTAVRCLHCHSDQVVKRGTTARGTQRSVCQKTRCVTGSFLLDSRHRGCRPEGKKLGIALRRNARGMRNTARSRRLSPDTVLRELTTQDTSLESVHTALLRTRNPEEVIVDMERAGEAERDEMWLCVGNTHHPRWLWHAMDHQTGKGLAYVFGRRKDEVCITRHALLEPCGLTHASTDRWGASTRDLDAETHTARTRSTQKIARTPLT